jgi:C-terminal processing protease CtpA/Prc
MRTKLSLLLLVLLLIALPVAAQDSSPTIGTPKPPSPTPTTVGRGRPSITATPGPTIAPTPVVAVNDADTGVQVVTGEYDFGDPSLPSYGDDPFIALIDVSGEVTHHYDPVTTWYDFDAPQILGALTSDINTAPVSYEIRLPINPGGTLHDVNHDGKTDVGVSVYDVSFGFNDDGDNIVESTDPVFSASDYSSGNYQDLTEVAGGKLIVYAPDGNQSFPSGFGADGKLFTDDDPIAPLEAGWTVVDLDHRTFNFDRSATASVDIYEGGIGTVSDFSDESYAQAFDSVVKTMRREYVFTDFYNLDWDAIHSKYRPAFEQADKDNDRLAYERALKDFLDNAIPDGHVGLIDAPDIDTLYQMPDNLKGSLGMTIRTLDDGRVVVNYITEDGPADTGGLRLRDEIVAIDGKPIADAIADAPLLNPPYSSASLKLLDQERAVLRAPVDTDVEVTFHIPGDKDTRTTTITTVADDESLSVGYDSVYGPLRDSNNLLDYKILPSGYGYVAFYAFDENTRLTLALWKRALQYFEDNSVSGLIIDMRYNNGGFPYLGNNMLGYLFDEQTDVGETSYYFPDVDRIMVNPAQKDTIVPAQGPHFDGKVAVLISPTCFSACEFFSWDLQSSGRARTVGYYSTGGLGGSVKEVSMPDDVTFQFTFGTGLDLNGNINIQETGVLPDIVVPVNEDTVFGDSDHVLSYAEGYLDDATTPTAVDIGPVKLGQTVKGTFEPFIYEDYTFTADTDETLTITLGDADGSLDTWLVVYDADGNELDENDDASSDTRNSQITGLDIKAGETITIEASTYYAIDKGDYTLTVEAE